MSKTIFLLFVRLQNLMGREQGQDVVEYSLLVGIIALTCITGVGHMASAVNKLFGQMGRAIP